MKLLAIYWVCICVALVGTVVSFGNKYRHAEKHGQHCTEKWWRQADGAVGFERICYRRKARPV